MGVLQGVTHATLHLSGPVQQAGLPATDARSQWEASLISGFSMYTGVATGRLRLLHVQGTPANSTAVDMRLADFSGTAPQAAGASVIEALVQQLGLTSEAEHGSGSGEYTGTIENDTAADGRRLGEET